jgi:hypothetical protein
LTIYDGGRAVPQVAMVEGDAGGYNVSKAH